jgi:ribosome small subunit-dependent GTPase A
VRKHQKASSSEEAAGLVVYNSADASEHGNIGILASINNHNYSILFNDVVISGLAESGEQKAILYQLAIGDNVVFEIVEGKPVLLGITVRHSMLARLRADASRISLKGAEEHILAANVDIAIIVASTVQPPFHTRLVDRYLIMCQYGNVKPLLCLTKIDLSTMPDLSMYKGAGLPIVEVSNATQEGISNLMTYLEGKRCVLVGNSGVGKSSLINSLLKKELLLTKHVSKKTGKGRHTTSTSSLHLINKSTILIDTPGIRSLGLWNVDKNTLRLYYPEFIEFAASCKFRDCTHSHEPECAVKKAVEAGLILRERYDSYVRLLTKD